MNPKLDEDKNGIFLKKIREKRYLLMFPNISKNIKNKGKKYLVSKSIPIENYRPSDSSFFYSKLDSLR